METESTQAPQPGDIYTVLGWLEKNRKQIITGIVVVILAGVAYFYFDWRRAEGQITAGEALSSTYLSAGGTNLSSATFLQVAEAHAGTDAAARALLVGGERQFLDGKTADAQATFQRFIAEYPESSLVAQAKYGLAVCLESQKKNAEAVAAYREVADRFAGENVVLPSKLALGRLYEAEGKFEQARDAYSEVARDPRRAVDSEAGTLLDELLRKHPELRERAPQPAPGRALVSPTPALKTPAPK